MKDVTLEECLTLWAYKLSKECSKIIQANDNTKIRAQRDLIKSIYLELTDIDTSCVEVVKLSDNSESSMDDGTKMTLTRMSDAVHSIDCVIFNALDKLDQECKVRQLDD